MKGFRKTVEQNAEITLEPDPIFNSWCFRRPVRLPRPTERESAGEILSEAKDFHAIFAACRPKANGSNPPVLDPFAPNPNDIKALNGGTEWTPVISKTCDRFTYYEYHVLSVDKHRSCPVASVSSEVHPGTTSDSSQQSQEPEAFLSTNGPMGETLFLQG
jgi:hypothetical protein